MKANELRIGNWVWNELQKIPVQVDLKILSDCLYAKKIKAQSGIDVSWPPISLDEMWLKKFGFKTWKSETSLNVGGENTIYFQIGNKMPIFWDNPKGLCLDRTSTVNTHHIKYVHQLQNLYKALTNEELKIKK